MARAAARGSVLVIDEDAATLGDRRLVAHLAADEPAANADLVTRLYLADAQGRHARPVVEQDWRGAPGAPAPTPADRPAGDQGAVLVDDDGRRYHLAVAADERDGAQLRWVRTPAHGGAGEPVGLRAVVGALQSYQPACALTEAAVREADVATAALAGQLERLRRSPTVLNRPLREAVRRAQRDGLTLSQIAARCGRLKSRRTGPGIGDTSWLARRVGLMPEVGRSEPSPWVHVDVLALIARRGLGIDPGDVEPTSGV